MAIKDLTTSQARRPFQRRRKTCPFSGPNAPKIDYKDVRLLQRYVSERGKIVPSRITAVSAKKQRDSPRRSSAPASSASCPTRSRKEPASSLGSRGWSPRSLTISLMGQPRNII